MTLMNIVIISLWFIGFSGGISLGAILSAMDDNRKCSWVWKFIFILSIVMLVTLLFSSSN